MTNNSSINELFARHPDSIMIVNRYDEIVYANPSATRLLCRIKDCGGYLPSVLRVFEGHYPAISLHDLVGNEIIIEVKCTTMSWHDQDARLLTLSDKTKTVQRQRELEKLVYRDELTGLNNRRGLEQQVAQMLSSAEFSRQRVHLYFIDVNRLKRVNDTLGHAIGDTMLQETAYVIDCCFGNDAIKARIGGDEFVVLQVVDDESSLETSMDQIKAALDKLNCQEERKYSLSLSIGVSQHFPNQTFDLQRLLCLADKSMYRAKVEYDVVQFLPKRRQPTVLHLLHNGMDDDCKIGNAYA